ncbi:hypothetical protein GCM10011507_15010 [Edaphobacter acidisoli]|uniref:DUF2946 domain-containing protein n=1 Tax=Edaphobacter acidisoli TaxID=2040573 RepID=A0A916RRJ0_9BACT|nr:hypothetical protein GCM10011507_15010 [Edaphobacter acidisoli]
MTTLGAKPGSRSTWRLLLAFLCIALVIVLGTVQVAHSHPDRLFHADCALCITAHVAVHATVPPVTLRVTHVESFVEALVLPSRQRTIQTFALFTRPPPVDAPLA